jgi:hypothetical protein
MVMKCASLVNGEMALSRKFTILGIPPAFDAPWTKLLTRLRAQVRGKECAALARAPPPLPLDRDSRVQLKPYGRIIGSMGSGL